MQVAPHIQRRAVPPHALEDRLPPLLQRVYAARGLTKIADLDLSLSQLPSFSSLAGIDAATALLAQALAERWRILVVGDFDADGATATALAVDGLRAFGAAEVDYLVPDRARHGYGLGRAIVAIALRSKPDLIITVDNGIASVEGVAAARAGGVKVLITDHHLPPRNLPAADGIVNPNLVDCTFPCKALAGVGVLFYVLLALRAHLREAGHYDAGGGPKLADYLDLVAVGTVADVVPLDHTNRILVKQGIGRIRAGRARHGIYALALQARREAVSLTATDIGFGLAPRLNAAGRLEHMGMGIDCLLAEDEAGALRHAQQLEALNAARRERQTDMQADAFAALDQVVDGDSALPAGLCLHQPDWHEGIVGLVAGRVRERYNRPVVAFATTVAGDLKGSARSIPGVHIRDVLEHLATHSPGLIERFGGHAMAAGLTLAPVRLPEFRTAFAAEVARWVTPAMLEGAIISDGALEPDEFSLEMAHVLREGGPWGTQFPEPVFDGVFEVLEQRIVGKHHLKLRLRSDDGPSVDAIAFNRDTPAPKHATMAFRLEVNRYRGAESLQLVVTAIG